MLIYFIAGVVQDFFFTLNVEYVAKGKVLPAVIFSFCAILTVMLVLYNILQDLNPQKSIPAIIIYSCGVAVGTYIAMKTPLLKGKK